ncbi:MAG: YfiT family bacillithiol transferase [Flavobacteriaceae bacterium]
MSSHDIFSLQYPIGKFEWTTTQPSSKEKKEILDVLKNFPALVEREVEGLKENELQTPYREGGWTIAQVVHHLADSHSHAYLRSKHALLESTPKIKDYAEAEWAKLEDASSSDVSPSILILKGVHKRWVVFFESLSESQFENEYHHPERSKNYPLYIVMKLYAWHSMHHLEHIRSLKKRMSNSNKS